MLELRMLDEYIIDVFLFYYVGIKKQTNKQKQTEQAGPSKHILFQ